VVIWIIKHLKQDLMSIVEDLKEMLEV
jgi:hypothetical protein